MPCIRASFTWDPVRREGWKASFLLRFVLVDCESTFEAAGDVAIEVSSCGVLRCSGLVCEEDSVVENRAWGAKKSKEFVIGLTRTSFQRVVKNSTGLYPLAV